MSTSPNLSWQPSLLEAVAETRIDEEFLALERIQLDPVSWVDFAPTWVDGSDALFAELLEARNWGRGRGPCTSIRSRSRA
jgi:hypothetical protein